MPTFTFVNSTGTGRHGPAERTAIKRQAMREIGAARRKAGNYGKSNLRQLPVFVDSPHDSRSASSSGDDESSLPSSQSSVDSPPTDISRSHSEERQSEHLKQPSQSFNAFEPLQDGLAFHCPDRESALTLYSLEVPHHQHAVTKHNNLLRQSDDEGAVPSSTLYHAATRSLTVPRSHVNFHLGSFERLRIEEDFDIINLSPLAGLHLGRAGIESFTSDSFQVKAIFQQKQWSYLSYIPSRYGHVNCLSQATDCLVARVRWMVSAGYTTDETTVISLYTKALKSLQVALNDPQQCVQPETLCATELLALFELFDNREEHAWIRHAKGAARVIEHRGPDRFNTDFEKALFMAHAGAIVTEALMNNHTCFLEQEPWLAVFRSIILKNEPFSDRSEIVISLWTNLLTGPGMFMETTALICTEKAPNPDTLEELIVRLFYHYNSILEWHERWHEHTDPKDSTPNMKTSFEPERRLEVHGTYLSVLLLKSRLLVALSPTRFQHLEEQAQALAAQILQLRDGAISTSPESGLFMSQTVWVAKATMGTAQVWGVAEPGTNLEGKGGMLERWRFEKWCKALGRKID